MNRVYSLRQIRIGERLYQRLANGDVIEWIALPHKNGQKYLDGSAVRFESTDKRHRTLVFDGELSAGWTVLTRERPSLLVA